MQVLFYIVAVLTSYTVSPESADTGIWPMDIGNQWNFEVTLQTPDGQKEIRTESIEILRDTTYNDMPWFIGDRFSLIEPKDDIMFYANRDDGHHWVENILYPDENTLIFKYPAEIGAEVVIEDEVKIILTSVDTLISVPAGDFECYHYMLPLIEGGQIGSINFFLNPKVGLVKFEFDADRAAKNEEDDYPEE